MRERNVVKKQELDQQFAALSAMLFPAVGAGHVPARSRRRP